MWLFLIVLGLWIHLCLAIGSLVTRGLRAHLGSRRAKCCATLGTGTAVFFSPAVAFITHAHLSAPGFYTERLPPAFETEETVQIEWTTGLCALAAFRYSQSAHEALAADGLAWLNTSPDTRAARKAPPRYMAWQPTPHPDQAYGLSGNRWFYGLGCLDQQEDMRQMIDRALNEPGSYYTSAGRAGKNALLLIPARRLIVYLADAS